MAVHDCPHCDNGIIQAGEWIRCCSGEACGCRGEEIFEPQGQDFCFCPEGQRRKDHEMGVYCDEAERRAVALEEGW